MSLISFLRVIDKLEQVEVERKYRKDVNELKAEVARLTRDVTLSEAKLTRSIMDCSNLRHTNDVLQMHNQCGADHNKVLIKEIARLKDELCRERYIYGRALADVSRGETIITSVFRHSGDYDRTNS